MPRTVWKWPSGSDHSTRSVMRTLGFFFFFFDNCWLMFSWKFRLYVRELLCVEVNLCFQSPTVGRWTAVFNVPSVFPPQREKDAGSRCIVSMVSSSITIQDPRDGQSRRSFSFDYAYWSHSGFVQDGRGLYLPEEPGGRYADQVGSW